ncbi:MAG: glycoside hydrolase family 3 protein [Bacteroidales bacterium]|nr:glycoside hydrolase family 3 protein [Bacteroidales bacterium]
MRKILILISLVSLIGGCMLMESMALSEREGSISTLNENNMDQIIAQLSLKEKASLVVGAGYKSMLSRVLRTKVPVPGAAGMTRAVPRLGIPAIVLSDGPAGVRIEPKRRGQEGTFFCTGFPIGSLLASTWNTEMVEKVGEAIGNEALEYGVDVMLAPGMNIQRNPLCGRNFEYFSEDPLLSGRTAAAYVRGVQSQGVGTSVKHFAANNQETNRLWNDSQVAEDVLRQIYLKNFEIAIKESAPWTVMASYNRLNGVHTQEDRWLLTEVLREEWGFEGLVMTDWTGKRHTPSQIQAGCDLMEPGGKSQIKELVKAVKKGELREADLDKCVRRVLELVVKTHTFKGHVPSGKPDLETHAAVAREAAEEGIVLLKNELGTLPLAKGTKIALFGVGSYQLLAGGTGSGHVHRPYVINLDQGLAAEGIQTDEPLSSLYASYIKKNSPRKTFMSNMLGSPACPEMPLSRENVEKASGEADYAILTLSRQAGEGGDRHLEDDFLLSDAEQRMLKDICEVYHAQGKRVIVVLNVGGVVETASWKHLPDAIVLAWQPGQEGGNALARILSGSVCPSGRLPVTFPVDYFDLPSSAHFPYDYKGDSSMIPSGKKIVDGENVGYTEYKEGFQVGYRYFSQPGTPEVSYPFGFGLSYTQFEVGEPVCAEGSVSVTVKNIGPVAGKEVVIVKNPYLSAFGKTRLLQPGESETLVLR